MGVGRVICVALPFILSVGSFVFLLIACLGGVTDEGLYMFRIDMREFEISRSELQDLLENVNNGNLTDGLTDIDFEDITKRDVPELDVRQNRNGGTSDNVTAEALGIDKIYTINLWGYCGRADGEDRECTDPQFDWANEHLNTSWLEEVGELSGDRVNLPDEAQDAFDAFKTLTRYTQIVYIVAFVLLALTIVFGFFANFTRIMSCITYIVAWLAAVAVGAAAGMSTAMSAVVVGFIEASASVYGSRAAFNTTFLALVWASTACALGAAFFWIFTICCCAPNHSSRKDRKRGSTDGEKLLSGNSSNTYQPLGSPNNGGFYNSQNASQYGAPRYPSGGAPRSDMAYEPYSHRN